MELTSIKSLVRLVLEEQPETRDSDALLIKEVYKRNFKMRGCNLGQISAYGLLDLMVEGDVPKTETIRRSRQALQQISPDLRGDSYAGQKESQAPSVRTITLF